MKVINDLYDYGLKIYQDSDYFKFSIDSILLAEFAKIKNNIRILDIATGNAPIPLILSTKGFNNIHIDGVEIQSEIYELAKSSIEFNNLENLIHLYNVDINNFQSIEKYDIITCNPPYFKISETTQTNDNPIKCIARHEIKLTLEEVILSANSLLKETGTFYMVHRVERLLESINLLEKYKFGIRQLVFVYTKKDKEAEFFLIEASKNKKSDLKVKSINIQDYKTYKNIFKKEE